MTRLDRVAEQPAASKKEDEMKRQIRGMRLSMVLALATMATSLGCGLDPGTGAVTQENGVGNVCWLSTCQPIHCVVPPGGVLHCEENTWADVDCDALCGGTCTGVTDSRVDSCGGSQPWQHCYGQTGANLDFCVANCVNAITVACSPLVADP